MEKNQQRSDMQQAIEDIALQDTLRIGEREQDEVERELRESLEKRLTGLQWQQQLNDQVTGTETVSQLQKDREQEGQEIRTRLQQRWQEQKQKEGGPDQLEESERGGRIRNGRRRVRSDRRRD